jgi:hypothetical protein
MPTPQKYPITITVNITHELVFYKGLRHIEGIKFYALSRPVFVYVGGVVYIRITSIPPEPRFI